MVMAGLSIDAQGTLKTLATVFNPDGNTTNVAATEQVYDALIGDARLVANVTINKAAVNAIDIGTNSPAVCAIAVDILDTVEGHKQRLGFGRRTLG